MMTLYRKHAAVNLHPLFYIIHPKLIFIVCGILEIIKSKTIKKMTETFEKENQITPSCKIVI